MAQGKTARGAADAHASSSAAGCCCAGHSVDASARKRRSEHTRSARAEAQWRFAARGGHAQAAVAAAALAHGRNGRRRARALCSSRYSFRGRFCVLRVSCLQRESETWHCTEERGYSAGGASVSPGSGPAARTSSRSASIVTSSIRPAGTLTIRSSSCAAPSPPGGPATAPKVHGAAGKTRRTTTVRRRCRPSAGATAPARTKS